MQPPLHRLRRAKRTMLTTLLGEIEIVGLLGLSAILLVGWICAPVGSLTGPALNSELHLLMLCSPDATVAATVAGPAE